MQATPINPRRRCPRLNRHRLLLTAVSSKHGPWKKTWLWCNLSFSAHQKSQEQKLGGVVAASVEAVSLQEKSVSQSSPTAKANRSDLTSLFRVGCQLQADIRVDLTLAPCVYRTTHRASQQHGGRRSLCHRPCCFQPAPWLRMATKESRSINLR